MAVNNSLAKKPAKMGLTAYLSQDAVKKQINNVVGGKNGTRLFQVLCLQPRQHRHYRNVRIRVFCLQHFWERR